MTLPKDFQIDPDVIAQQSSVARTRELVIQSDYAGRAVPPEAIGHRTGPVHCASLLVWARLAELAGVPFIPATTIVSLPSTVVEALIEGDDIPPEHQAAVDAATAYAESGGFWRTELCAGEDVKFEMSRGSDLPDRMPFHLQDMRILDLHYGMPDVKMIARPRMTPVRVNCYPVEFRVFNGGHAAAEGAVSFYYPQAGEFEITPDLQHAMRLARYLGGRLHAARAMYGLVPWNPARGPADVAIGSTIDFMLTRERGLVMVDAGPGWGYGAHPCCFLETEVVGERWRLADGVELY